MGKQLKDIFLEYPHVSLASQRENDELLEFYHRTEMTVKDNSIIYKRGNDFFCLMLFLQNAMPLHFPKRLQNFPDGIY